MPSLGWFSFVFLLAACGVEGTPELELGTGVDAFVPLEDGARVPIVCGMQGGQHAWVSLRMRHLDFSRVAVEFAITVEETGATVCEKPRGEVSVPRDGELLGVLCFVPEPTGLDGRSALLRAAVEDRSGRQAESEVRIVLEGPGRSCML